MRVSQQTTVSQISIQKGYFFLCEVRSRELGAVSGAKETNFMLYEFPAPETAPRLFGSQLQFSLLSY